MVTYNLSAPTSKPPKQREQSNVQIVCQSEVMVRSLSYQKENTLKEARHGLLRGEENKALENYF